LLAEVEEDVGEEVGGVERRAMVANSKSSFRGLIGNQ
jgi:hypothetical protein